jgi:signal transduction histidine kinase
LNRFLLIEDNPGDAELVRVRLRDSPLEPHELIVAETLEEGLAECARATPHVTLLDMNLPDSDGLETVRRVRAACEEGPIVVLTGMDDIETAVSALREGADDYVGKLELLRDGALVRPIRYAVERRRVLTELHFAVRARAELLAIVSHDVRNHLSTIGLGVSLIRTKSAAEDIRKPLASIERASTTSVRLLDDLVDLAAVERGALVVSVTDVDVVAMLREVHIAFSASAEQKGLRFEIDVADKAVMARGDALRVAQVLGNLVANALKLTPPGGVITVGARAVDDEVILRVEDTGPGIPVKDRVRIFERFFRGSKPTGKGVGLGLAIARALIEAQRGRIWVESEEGRGATFFFSLPRCETS